MAKRIRIILVPSDTYNLCSHGCSLHKVADRLNECQTTYKFCVPTERVRSEAGKLSRTGVSFRRDRILVQLRTDETDHVKSDEWSALRGYFVDTDIFEQTLRFVDRIMMKKGSPLSDTDIVVALGSEVAVTDDPANTFQSDAAADSYACLSVEADKDFPVTMGLEELLANNDDPLPL